MACRSKSASRASRSRFISPIAATSTSRQCAPAEATAVDRPLRDIFDTPDLAAMDDAIANGTLELPPGAPEPLALFRAARVDYSLHRLYHYTGTDPEHFQNFVIFTNYQFYVDAFARLCRERMSSGQPGSDAFVEPGNVITRNARLGGGTSGDCARAHAADAGLSSGRARLSRHYHGQHRHRPVQCPQYHRPRRGAAAACLADAGTLRGLEEYAEARRLCPRPRLCAGGSCARRGIAAVGADPRACRDAGRARTGGR